MGCFPVGAKPPCCEQLHEQAISSQKRHTVARNLEGRGHGNWDQWGRSAYFCLSKNTSHTTETAHPQPPTEPNFSLLEKSKLAEAEQTFIYIV